MLQGLDDVPWATLEHAYGSAADIPDLLRRLLDPDLKVRSKVMDTLYGNVFHQGTRYPATPYVIPFLIDLCANPLVPNRYDLLRFWGSLITGYFSIQERPCWGDGERIFEDGEILSAEINDPYSAVLHQIYRESLKGQELLYTLLTSEEMAVRAGAAWVLACLPTLVHESLPRLEARIAIEPSGWVRAAFAFTLGELGAADLLGHIIAQDEFTATCCIATCQLARISPTEALIEPLLRFVSQPIEGYADIPGAGGKSTGDAAFSISYLPADVRRRAIPAICERLDQVLAFDTIPLVSSLLATTFSLHDEPITELTDLQRQVLIRMVNNEELWSMGNLIWTFKAYGLPHERKACAQLVNVQVTDDEALKLLRSGIAFTEINFLEKARECFLKALKIDSDVFERAPAPDECWLLFAKAFADSEPKQALTAFQQALALNPRIAHRVDPAWHLADLLIENELN